MMKKILILLLFLNSQHTFAAFIVDINWLKKNLGQPGVILVDMSDNTQYQRFHIPGAIHLPYQVLNRRDKKGVSYSIGKENIPKLLGYLGITSDSNIIIYDDMGGLHAGRLFWELEKIGHKKMALLDGGLVSWILDGNKVTNVPTKPERKNYSTATDGKNNLAQIESILEGKQQGIVIDARSLDEYTGHKRYPRSGHIPGAKWLEWQNFVDFENGFRLKKEDQLKQLLKNIGLSDKNTPVTLYCQSGHRASQSYFTLRHLGYKNVRLYDGSMAEYSKNRQAPLKRGKQP